MISGVWILNRRILRIEKAKGIETSMVNPDKTSFGGIGKALCFLQKPLDKITISDLTKDCGISRMAFYYHLRIYMIWWSGPAWKMPQGHWRARRLTLHGQKDCCRFSKLFMNKPFIMNVYRCISREQIENFLFQLTSDLIMGVVKEQGAGCEYDNT